MKNEQTPTQDSINILLNKLYGSSVGNFKPIQLIGEDVINKINELLSQNDLPEDKSNKDNVKEHENIINMSISSKDSKIKYVIDIPGIDPSNINVSLLFDRFSDAYIEISQKNDSEYITLLKLDIVPEILHKYNFNELSCTYNFGQLILTAVKNTKDINTKSIPIHIS